MCAGLILSSCVGQTVNNDASLTRGIGIYPGNPAESFAPVLKEAKIDSYHNIAAHKTVYHSSAYDYNLTGQLVTDNIITDKPSATMSVITPFGEVAKNEREWLFDQIDHTYVTFEGSHLLLQLGLENLQVDADHFVLTGTAFVDLNKPKGYDITVSASADGQNWEVLEELKGNDYWGKLPEPHSYKFHPHQPAKKNPSPVIFKYDYTEPDGPEPEMKNYWGTGPAGMPVNINYSAKLPNSQYHYFKIEGDMPSVMTWRFANWDFYKGEEFQCMLPSLQFNSAWKSAGNEEEWVYVDFGAKAQFDKVKLFWINKAVEGKIQVSDNAADWTDVESLPYGDNNEDEITLKKEAKGRYLRVLCQHSANARNYELGELQVFGKGGIVAEPLPQAQAEERKLMLNGGNWKLQRGSEVKANGVEISSEGFNTQDWIWATVPGTILSSYRNVAALPDPNFADNQLQISDSYFLSDFWYHNEFEVSDLGERTFLNFDGINWKAEVFLNGKNVGQIDGAFMKGKFDVTSSLKKGKNILAVKIIRNAHPGAVKEQTAFSADANGGILGADNSTFHASIGWDWIPTIRGRNTGIWNDVYLTFTGAVTIEDPFIRAELPLPDTTYADLFAEVTLKNHELKPIKGILKGKYGEAAFAQEVSLDANEEKLVRLNPSNAPALHLENPRLWWPKGYGEPYLYDVELAFETEGKVSDKTNFKSGVRQMTFEENDYLPSGGIQRSPFGRVIPKRLSIYINGRRFVGFGGNWGFSESNLNYRAREYDIAVAYHADMNFTMIRNWVGMTGDEEFYEACDRHGVMVWQDFWLANPSDGPDPYYNDLFCANAKDWVKRLRNHPSIAIYVGRNEGNPPAELDNYLRTMLSETHPGMHFISHSADGVVSGGGPYRALSQKEYFQNTGHDKFHSERGMPNVMAYESLVQTIGETNLSPLNTMEHPNAMYGLHDYTLSSAQGADSFNKLIETMFGTPKDAKQFTEWAQWINYNGYRAIFEGRSEHRRGMLLWMSHTTWPSMVWQTYDYYFDPTAAYFACKKACEPLHIQWNPVREDVEVVNYHAGSKKDIKAVAYLLNQDGKEVWKNELSLDIEDDQTVACFPLALDKPTTETYYIKLLLSDKDGTILSENFYVRGKNEDNYQSLLSLPKTTITTDWKTIQVGDQWIIEGTIKNDSDVPALMIRLQVKGNQSQERILPAFYNDNYFALMPGEVKKIRIKVAKEDCRGEQPFVEHSGFNLRGL